MALKNHIDSSEPVSIGISATEIKKWDDSISQAKTPKEKTKLRADFKKTYNINFSQKLVAEIIAKENAPAITGGSPEPIKTPEPEAENKSDFQTVVAEVKQNIINLDDLVKMQKSAEDQEASDVADPELAKATGVIDAERDDTLTAADNALNDFIDPSLSHLSDIEKKQIDLLDEKLEALGASYVSKRQILTNPGLEKEEAERLERESTELEDQMAEIIKQKNEIKGIKATEPEPETKPAISPEPEPTTEPDPTLPPTPEPPASSEPNPGQTPEPNLPPTPEPPTTPEPEKISNLDKFWKFSISEEELKNLPAFSSLSEGQQDIVYEGLKQLSLIQVKDRARESVAEAARSKQKAVNADKGFFKFYGAILSNAFNGAKNALTKKYNTAKLEKIGARRSLRGGLEMHGENIEEISKMISAIDIDVEIKDGKPTINYLRPESYHGPEGNEIISKFNEAANAFRDIPADWGLETASKKEREIFEAAKNAYENSKSDALDVLKTAHGERNALVEICKIDSKVKLVQALSANPEADKELSRIVKQSAFRKMLTGEVAARGSYMASGFVARHTIAGIIGFGAGVPVALASIAAMPIAAAGVGLWRGRNQAKANLIEKDIIGRKTDKNWESQAEARRNYYFEELKKIVPEYYSADPYYWLNNHASDEEKGKYEEASRKYRYANYVWQQEKEETRDKTAKNFSDSTSLTDKLDILTDKVYSGLGSDEQFKNNLYSLQTRIDFIEDKLADGLVNFGSEEALQNKLNFTQALGRARLAVVYNERLLKEKEGELAEQKASNPNAVRDVKERFENLFNSKKIEFTKNLDAARKKEVIGAMLKGAGIGATFALVGVIAREFAVQFGWLHNNHNTILDHKIGNQNEAHASGGSDPATSRSAAAVENANANNVAETTAESNGSQPVEETTVDNSTAQEAATGKTFSDEITGGDSVWRSTRDLFKNNAEELGYKGDIDDTEALNKWAETQTANAIHNTGEFTDKVFEGNKVLLEKNLDGDFSIKVEAGNGAAPGFSETAEVAADAPAQEIIKNSSEDALQSAINKTVMPGTENIVNPGVAEVADPNEAAADALAKKYLLDPDDFSYGGAKGILKTTVNEHDLFIDTNTGTQYLGSLNGSHAPVELTGGGILNAVADYKAILDNIAPYEALAKQSGFEVGDNIINSRGQLITNLANHQIAVDFENHTLNYDWNGENHEFQFTPGAAAKANILTFLSSRGSLEKLAEGIQDNLMSGKIKSFAALQNRLEEINGGTRLSDGEKSMWREIFQDNFGRKSSSLLDDGAKFKILQTTMNVFLSGGAK